MITFEMQKHKTGDVLTCESAIGYTFAFDTWKWQHWLVR